MRLTIIRHAQSEGNVAENLGFPHTPLTAQGHEQARLVALRLQGEEFDAIIISPYTRTRETAAPVIASRTIEPVFDVRAQEHNFGEFHGTPYGGYRETAVSKHEDWREFRPLDGESVYDLRLRILALIDDLRSQHNGKNVLLVTHGGAIVNLLLGLYGDDVTMVQSYRQWNTAVSILEFPANGLPKIVFLNDLSHLPAHLHSR